MTRLWILLATAVGSAVAAPSGTTSSLDSRPTVTFHEGTVIGNTTFGIDSFRGIPYAQPPVGNLRLRPPQRLNKPFGRLVLPTLEGACYNQNLSQLNTTGLGPGTDGFIDEVLNTVAPDQSEDCLTISVQRPTGVKPDAKLPVLVWFFGGAFAVGSSQTYDATEVILQSMTTNSPFVFVVMNYRNAVFGFLNGKELSGECSTNLGLRDQRLALEWVADNIAAFGGDPNSVTLAGESSGGASAFNHLIINGGDHTYRGKALFHGAFMSSAASFWTLPAKSSKAQAVYDEVAAAAGCSHAANSLDCLRRAPIQSLVNAQNAQPDFLSYKSLDLSYLPRQDDCDNFFSTAPDEALLRGAFARVPVILGSQEDEGTLLATPAKNVTTTEEVISYFQPWFPKAPRPVVAGLVSSYPQNPAAGSPFRTGDQYALTAQYKRMAAIQGDYIFSMQRRFSAELLSRLVPAWSYLATYLWELPGYQSAGTFHISDVPEIFGDSPIVSAGQTIDSYLINFVNTHNPNVASNKAPHNATASATHWPCYSPWNQELLNISAAGLSLVKDNFRQANYHYLTSHRDVIRV